ncbi:MAG: hypothetical protein HOO96_28990 [Polyangiaceae bacterium]|nr:hypothetical protein [Polyangiaceae bacterium]
MADDATIIAEHEARVTEQAAKLTRQAALVGEQAAAIEGLKERLDALLARSSRERATPTATATPAWRRWERHARPSQPSPSLRRHEPPQSPFAR